MTDLGLTAIWLFGALISIFIGTGMIYKEIDKRTLYTILSKPIARWTFVLGKYFGLLLTTYVNLAILSAVFLTYLASVGAPVTAALLQALLLIFCEMMMLTALAILFSTASTPVLSAIFTFVIFAIGQLSKWLVDLGLVVKRASPLMELLLKGIYLLTPNLHNFNIRREAVRASYRLGSEAEAGWQLAIPMDETFNVVVYGLSYTTALLLATIFVFRRRNF
jgi:ABC-type transport system involved in multi-copper enzyme maturation permease subunit